ncbi:MAG: hypothetical protein IJV16_02750 [Lachnospiraceae bacterium]|nr:hypothetical protein [Lachnospiraceae bacterium]
MSKKQWNTIQNEHPDRWVALTDVETKEGAIVCANVIDECFDQELSAMKKKYRPLNKDRHIWFVRTSEGSVQYCVHLLNAQCEVV